MVGMENKVTLIDNGFLINGQSVRIIAGAVHYFRVPRAYWRDRLLKLFSEHLAEHLRLPHDNNLSAAMLTGTIAAFLSIAKSNKSLEERKQDLYDYIVTLAFGLPDLTNP